MSHTSTPEHVCSPKPCSLWHMPPPSQAHDTTLPSVSLSVTSPREGAVDNATLTSNARAPGLHNPQAENQALAKKPSFLQQPVPPLLPRNGTELTLVGQQALTPLTPRLPVPPRSLHSQCCQARGTGHLAPCPKGSQRSLQKHLPAPTGPPGPPGGAAHLGTQARTFPS